MFLLNSPSRHLSAAEVSYKSKSLHSLQRTFSRSYGTILPSSFTRVLPSALVSSTRPPVSVWGTANVHLKLRDFSREFGENNLDGRTILDINSQIIAGSHLTPPATYSLEAEQPLSALPYLLRHPIAMYAVQEY